MLAISVDEPADSQRFAAELSTWFPLLHDPGARVAESYGAASKHDDIAVPAIVIVAPDGRVVWREVGDTIADRVSAKQLLAQLDAAATS